MNYETYVERASEVLEYFVPGKSVKLADTKVYMMSIENRYSPPDEGDKSIISGSQLPIIMCVYSTKKGELMEVCIEWSDLVAMRVMNPHNFL